MLIHVDPSAVADALSASSTAGSSRDAIENLLLARWAGAHVVSLMPEDAQALQALPLSRRAARALADIDTNYPQVAAVRKHVRWHLEVGLGEAFDGRAGELPSGRRIIRAPLHAFLPPHTTQGLVLLGENGTDADVFRQLGRMAIALRRWQLEIEADARGAGGDTFAPEFARVADRGHIVLALADSDRRYPGGSAGQTYRKLEAAAASRPAYQRAREIPARTIEGLIPARAYREAFLFPHKAHDPRLATVDRIEALLRREAASARYAPLKDGITLHQVEHGSDEQESAHWRGLAERADRASCREPPPRQCTSREGCACYVVDGLGPQAIRDVLAWMKSVTSARTLASRFGLAEQPEVFALAEEILAFGLVPVPIRT